MLSAQNWLGDILSILTDHVKYEDNHKPQPNVVKRGRETISGLNNSQGALKQRRSQPEKQYKRSRKLVWGDTLKGNQK